MGIGIGRYCECCGEQLDIHDSDRNLCNTCKNETIPMVMKYMAGQKHPNSDSNDEEGGYY